LLAVEVAILPCAAPSRQPTARPWCPRQPQGQHLKGNHSAVAETAWSRSRHGTLRLYLLSLAVLIVCGGVFAWFTYSRPVLILSMHRRSVARFANFENSDRRPRFDQALETAFSGQPAAIATRQTSFPGPGSLQCLALMGNLRGENHAGPWPEIASARISAGSSLQGITRTGEEYAFLRS